MRKWLLMYRVLLNFSKIVESVQQVELNFSLLQASVKTASATSLTPAKAGMHWKSTGNSNSRGVSNSRDARNNTHASSDTSNIRGAKGTTITAGKPAKIVRPATAESEQQQGRPVNTGKPGNGWGSQKHK
jgi:hypothetical protein